MFVGMFVKAHKRINSPIKNYFSSDFMNPILNEFSYALITLEKTIHKIQFFGINTKKDTINFGDSKNF